MTDNQQQQRPNALIERVDTNRLGAMQAETSAYRANFMPASFGEAMEMAKLMSAGTFVPDRLRGKPGDCLALVMLASRLSMDPFILAQEVYFVNSQGIPGYGAKLVAAIVNTSGRLDGSLHVEWEGEGEALVCYVTGKVRGDPREKKLKQPIKTITTRNSPLWKQAPMVQLGYHTQRSWARLYMPEALLGIYAADELVEDGATARLEAPPKPTRGRSRDKQDEPVAERETLDPETGEVAESEEETARRLDAEAEAAQRGLGEEVTGDGSGEARDEVDDASGAAQEERSSGAAADSQSAGSSPSTASQPGREDVDAAREAPVGDSEAAGPNKIGEKIDRIAGASGEAEPTIDWESWLNKLDTDLGRADTAEAVDKLIASKQERLAAAPGGVQNRARGYAAARKREIEKPPTETKPAARRGNARTAAAAAGGAEQNKSAEPSSADEPAPSVNEQRADAIIAEFNGKALLVDLRAAKTRLDSEIDALDDENAGRVNRAFRALEDKLRNRSAA